MAAPAGTPVDPEIATSQGQGAFIDVGTMLAIRQVALTVTDHSRPANARIHDATKFVAFLLTGEAPDGPKGVKT